MLKIALLLSLCPLIFAGGSIPARIGKIYNKPKIGLATFSLLKSDGLRTIDEQRLLDSHNALRKYLATGKETHSYDGHGGFTRMPTAANMQAMSWDDNLAKYAQNWASQCKGSQHSSLKGDPLLKDYKKGFLAESLSGSITAQERDMYGEVQWWNYDSFECRSDKNCGHYLAFANAQFNHLGCGYKVCNNGGMNTSVLVCIYGGNNPTAIEDGATRLPWQHEYLKGEPCSKCQQGWDYCMGGGLCATKKQCESDPSNNNCKCLHSESECQGNGGTFNADECTCTCPAGKMGINCASPCANTNPDCRVCGPDAGEKLLCEKLCGSCGTDKSAGYKWTFVDRNAPNAKGIVTRCKLLNNDAIARTRKPQGQKYCKNSASDGDCEELKERGYCKDPMIGEVVVADCKLSCNAKCKAPDNLKKSDFDDLLKSMGVSTGAKASGGGPAKGTDAASALGGMGDLTKGMDLAGFSVVRRRRR